MDKKTILHLVITPDMAKHIDNYRFEHRFDNKSDAVRFLLGYALKQNPKP